MFPRCKTLDLTGGLPLREAAPKIARRPCRRLVAVLRSLGKQLGDDRDDSGRHILKPLTRKQRLSCDVAMHPFHWLGSGERQAPRKHFVKRDPE